MIVEFGVIVALGLVFTFAKLKWSWRMKFLSNPLATDIVVFISLNVLHWGTFSGLMVAAVGALVCSGLISLGRWLYGYQPTSRTYVPGIFNVSDKLRAEMVRR